jgi:methyl-accepting chemotaxis protein
MTADAPSLLPEAVERSYAARLGVALAIAIVVIVGFGAVISTQASATLQEDVQGDLETLSETRADQLGTWLDSVRRETVMTEQHQDVRSGDADTVDAVVDYAVKRGVPADAANELLDRLRRHGEVTERDGELRLL